MGIDLTGSTTFFVLLLFVAGLVCIIKGGDFFVDAATWIAEASGIPKFIIGATVVSFATTMPEMLVSVFSAFEGNADIAVGNAVFVLVLWLILRKKQDILRSVLGVACASAAKFLALYLLVVQLLCRVLTMPEKMVATFSTMFSWPQLVTALIGSAVAVAIIPLVKRARRA